MQTNTASAYLEHLNITVSDPDKTAATLMQLFDWQCRWAGASMDEGYTVHVGNDQCYIALYSRADLYPAAQGGHSRLLNLNHLAVVVPNLETIQARAVSLGMQPFNHGNYEPGKRFYVYVEDELEIEVVSYAA